jgi:hypothetical protein
VFRWYEQWLHHEAERAPSKREVGLEDPGLHLFSESDLVHPSGRVVVDREDDPDQALQE